MSPQPRPKLQSAQLLKNLSIPSGVEAEVSIFESEERSLAWGDGQSQNENWGWSRGLSLRVIEKGSQSVVTTTKIEDQEWPSLLNKSLSFARLTPADFHRTLFHAVDQNPTDISSEREFFSTPAGEIQLTLREMEKSILSFDPRIKKVVKLRYDEHREERVMANSHSVETRKTYSSASVMGEVLAEEKGGSEVAWDVQIRRSSRDLDFNRLAQQLAIDVVQSLGGRPLPSGSYSVLVHPRVGTQIVSLLAQALSAEAVQFGRSFFKGKMGSRAASEQVSLVDDPFLQGGLASASTDDEGVPHQFVPLVSQGELKNYFYDLFTAAKDGVSSNGHGIKESLSSLPRPKPTNFFMKSGSVTVEDMIKSEKQVFLLREVMGLHMVDTISGEFSLGAQGLFYESGKLKQSVHGVTVAGRLSDLLLNIKAVGNDLAFYGAIGSPSFLVSEMTVAGT